MKRNIHFFLLAIMAMAPCTMLAQTSIERYFSHFGESGVTITQSFHQKNPQYGNRSETGSLDYYEFKTDHDATKLVGDVEAAFNASASESYSMSMQNGTQSLQKVQVDYSQGQSIRVGEHFENYTYMCFADEAHKDFRTIYVFEWNYIGKKQKKLEGRFFRAYSLKPNLMSKRTTISLKDFGDLSLNGLDLDTISIKLQELATDSLGDLATMSHQLAEKLVPLTMSQLDATLKSSAGWLQTFNSYRSRFLRNPDGTVANFYATKIYELCKNNKCLNDSEKNLVAGEVNKMIGKSKDKFYDSLFNMALEALKE